MRIKNVFIPTLISLAGMLSIQAARADLIVPSGGIHELNSGDESLACTQASISGVLDAGSGTLARIKDFQIRAGGVVKGGSGTLEVNGNWANAGTFEPGTGTVRLSRACGQDTITLPDNTDFANLVIDASSGPLHVVLPPHSVQGISGQLSFVGDPQNIHIDGGTCSGLQFVGGGSQSGQSNNIHLGGGAWVGQTPPPGCPGKEGGGGSTPHPPTDARAIPTLGTWALAGLALLLAGLATGRGGRVLPRTRHRP